MTETQTPKPSLTGRTFKDQFGTWTVLACVSTDEHGPLYEVRDPDGHVVTMYHAFLTQVVS